MSGRTILLVEDNFEDIAFFNRAFGKAALDCGLRVADDGQSAVEILSAEAETPDPSRSLYVVLDLKLPRKSGLEVLAWIRAHPRLKPLPVIVLTSSDLPSDKAQARALGIDAFMVKPLTSAGLKETILEIAARWKIPVRTPVGSTPPTTC